MPPLHPALDFEDDGASFRVRRARQLAATIIDVPNRDRGVSPWALWLIRAPVIVLLLFFLAAFAAVIVAAIATAVST